jgi:hypothetical protein
MLAKCQYECIDEPVEVQRNQEVTRMARAGVEPASSRCSTVQSMRLFLAALSPMRSSASLVGSLSIPRSHFLCPQDLKAHHNLSHSIEFIACDSTQ